MHDDERREDARDPADDPGAQADKRLELTVAARRHPPLETDLAEQCEGDHDRADEAAHRACIDAGQHFDPEDRAERQAHQQRPEAAHGVAHVAAAKRLPGVGDQKRDRHQRDRSGHIDDDGHGCHRNGRQTAPGKALGHAAGDQPEREQGKRRDVEVVHVSARGPPGSSFGQAGHSRTTGGAARQPDGTGARRRAPAQEEARASCHSRRYGYAAAPAGPNSFVCSTSAHCMH